MLLGEIAEIMRCQTHRQTANQNQKGELLELTPENFRTVGHFVHFAPQKTGNWIMAELNSRARKFILQQNDILVRMIGGIETIGTTCLITDQPEIKTIPSKSLLLIRPIQKDIDPIWLYYRLSQNDIKTYLQEGAIKSRPNYITYEMMKGISLNTPDETAINAAHKTHKKFMENLWMLENRQEEEKQEWINLAKLLK